MKKNKTNQKPLPVFYMPEQTAASNNSFSPSAGKPAKVLAEWQRLGLNIEVRPFKPCKLSQIALAHSTEYVHGVLSRSQSNGFGNKSEDVAKSLPYTTGSFVAAALNAFLTKQNSASLTSGFHHAGYARGGGFCTFNGLIVAAQILRLRGAKKIGIIDLDQHYGDGTDSIIKKLGLDYIQHYTFGQHSIQADKASESRSFVDVTEDHHEERNSYTNGTKASEWLKELPNIVDSFSSCDVILCQLGADPYINDPLGGILTMEQMRLRDEIVFKVCAANEVPVAWNLAGGYTRNFQEVLDIHTQSAIECLAIGE